MIGVTAFTIVALITIIFLKKQNPEYALLISAAAGAVLLVTVIGWVYSPLSNMFQKLADYGVKSYLVEYLLKVFAICYLTKFASELCNDFDQTSLSAKIELAGRGTVFILTLPLLDSVLEVASSLV
jgi:stage III sporulation protein AD